MQNKCGKEIQKRTVKDRFRPKKINLTIHTIFFYDNNLQHSATKHTQLRAKNVQIAA